MPRLPGAVYLICWKKPISLYPVSELDEALEQQVDPYLSGRSTAKFALTKPIPRMWATSGDR